MPPDQDRDLRANRTSIHQTIARVSGLPSRRVRQTGLICQLLVTAAIVAWLPNNFVKLAAMLGVWKLGFGRLKGIDLAVMAAVNLLFTTMNLVTLKRGIFTFDRPDVLGMPIYEFAMWGFYTLHVVRFLGGPAPVSGYAAAVVAAAAFSLLFGTVPEPGLLSASASALVICFVLFHQQMDLIYAGYMALVGALIEYSGVLSGQWHYPGHPDGCVPLWFVTMWAGIGLFTRRLLLPLLPGGQSAV